MIALAGLSFGGLFVVLLEDLSVIRAVVGTVWAIGLYALIARAAVPTFGAQRDGWRTPRWLFYPVLVMGVVSMLISVPLLVGQSG
jgi:hypothetical protein